MSPEFLFTASTSALHIICSFHLGKSWIIVKTICFRRPSGLQNVLRSSNGHSNGLSRHRCQSRYETHGPLLFLLLTFPHVLNTPEGFSRSHLATPPITHSQIPNASNFSWSLNLNVVPQSNFAIPSSGIGLEITALLLQRPSTTVIATVREDTLDRTASLSVLPTAKDSKVIILTYDLSNSPRSLMATIKCYDIRHIDVVIANAGNSCAFKSVLETSAQELRDDFDTNCVAVLRLFQHCWPMMRAAPRENRKFVLISSTMGSIDTLEIENLPGLAYGASKAAANWLAKKISVELKPHVDVGIFHPG